MLCEAQEEEAEATLALLPFRQAGRLLGFRVAQTQRLDSLVTLES